jgi:hypothetical protein
MRENVQHLSLSLACFAWWCLILSSHNFVLFYVWLLLPCAWVHIFFIHSRVDGHLDSMVWLLWIMQNKHGCAGFSIIFLWIYPQECITGLCGRLIFNDYRDPYWSTLEQIYKSVPHRTRQKPWRALDPHFSLYPWRNWDHISSCQNDPGPEHTLHVWSPRLPESLTVILYTDMSLSSIQNRSTNPFFLSLSQRKTYFKCV